MRPWSVHLCALQRKCPTTQGSGNSLGTRSVRKGSPVGTAIRKEPATPQQSPFPVTGVTVQCRSREEHRELISCSSLLVWWLPRPACGWRQDTPPEGQGGQRAEGHADDIIREAQEGLVQLEPTRTTQSMDKEGFHHLKYSFHLDF